MRYSGAASWLVHQQQKLEKPNMRIVMLCFDRLSGRMLLEVSESKSYTMLAACDAEEALRSLAARPLLTACSNGARLLWLRSR